MELIHTTHNVKYLPLPNRVEFVATQKIAPIHLTKTSFVIPFLNSEHVVLANNQRRGLEIPGGHVEDGEQLFQAAQREGLEETGYVINDIIPIGFLKMTSDGSIPDDWKYPHPISYQQFFAGEVSKWVGFSENDECKNPVALSMNSLDQLTEQQIALISKAHQAIYANGDNYGL